MPSDGDAETELDGLGLLETDPDTELEGLLETEPETDALALLETLELLEFEGDLETELDGLGLLDTEPLTDADGELDGLPRSGNPGGTYRAKASRGHRSLATIAGKTTPPTTGGHLIFAKILGITRPKVNSMESWQPHLDPRQ